VRYPIRLPYGSILHHFGHKARYWSKIVIFIPPLHTTPQLGGCYRRNNAKTFRVKKTWMAWLPDGKNMFICFDRMYERDRQTDGRTDIT